MKIQPFHLNDDDKDEDKPGDAGHDSILMQQIIKTRTILLAGEINKTLSERIVRQLLLLEDAGGGPIKVFIDSPGGDADAGFAIFDMIRFITSEVYTIGMGLVASAAAIVLLAAPKTHRMGLPNSHYLIHQPLSGIRGVATEIEIHARELEKLRTKINQLIAEESGQELGKVEKDTDRDYWMSAEDAVEYGLITKIITKREELPDGKERPR